MNAFFRFSELDQDDYPLKSMSSSVDLDSVSLSTLDRPMAKEMPAEDDSGDTGDSDGSADDTGVGGDDGAYVPADEIGGEDDGAYVPADEIARENDGAYIPADEIGREADDTHIPTDKIGEGMDQNDAQTDQPETHTDQKSITTERQNDTAENGPEENAETDNAGDTKEADENCKTDDNGNVYMKDGKLLPNSTYELNGNTYTTDEKGRIVACEATPNRTPENSRDIDAQREVGGEDRRLGDQGGHNVSRDMGGDAGLGNLVPMDSRINQSDYKRMENDIKNDVDAGKDVSVKTELSYSDDSERPDRIKVTKTADGKDTVYIFDNNMDGSLMDEVPEEAQQDVQSELDKTGGVVSSIKKEYDENGNLEKVTVNITYTDENGERHRTKVEVPMQKEDVSYE